MSFSLTEEIISARRIATGRTNRSLHIDLAQGPQYVLRLTRQRTGKVHIIDREAEKRIFQAASQVMLAPQVLKAETHYIASEFYANNNDQDAMSSIDQIVPFLRQFYRQMNELEGIPVFEDVLEQRMARVRESGIQLPSTYLKLEEFVRDTMASGQYFLLPRAVCHLDLTPLNVLFGPKGIKFIDFEMANQGPILLDLASLSVGYRLTDEQDKQLVQKHYGDGHQDLNNFYRAKLCYQFRCVLWLLLQSGLERNPILRRNDEVDLALDIEKAFRWKDKIGDLNRGYVRGHHLLLSAGNPRP